MRHFSAGTGRAAVPHRVDVMDADHLTNDQSDNYSCATTFRRAHGPKAIAKAPSDNQNKDPQIEITLL